VKKKIIETTAAPSAVGPYSQAVRANGFIFVSGQLPADPYTGELVRGDIARAAERTIGNIQIILEAAGAGLDDVVKTTVYLKDMGDFARVNEVYAKYFTKAHPARVCVAVRELPKDADIEIDAIAIAAKE
jgi:2-iminobutanoate/2-iminopropanoate deaminase